LKIKDDANRPKNVCFNGLLADADPCRLCRDVYMGKLGWAKACFANCLSLLLFLFCVVKIEDAAKSTEDVCLKGLLADADPCRLCRDVYPGKLGWAEAYSTKFCFLLVF